MESESESESIKCMTMKSDCENICDITYRKGKNGDIQIYNPNDEFNVNSYDQIEKGLVLSRIEQTLHVTRCNFRGDDKYIPQAKRNKIISVNISL